MKLIKIIILTLIISSVNCAYSATIINFKDNFTQFWQHAKNKEFHHQERLFSKYIESRDPSFYNINVWGAKNSTKWEEKRKDTLRGLFKTYASVPLENIEAAYDLYEKKVNEALLLFQQKAPDFDNEILIMIAPGITWGGSYMPGEEREYLGLGVDVYLSKDTLLIKPLAVHEMFHYYHKQRRSGNHPGFVISESEYIQNGKLFWQLWDEGMGLWGTGFITENYGPDYLLMSATTGVYNLSNEQLSRYAKLFLEELEAPAIDFENPINVKKWFGAQVVDNPLGIETPSMIGYYLGFLVIRAIEMGGTPREEFMGWDYSEAKQPIIRELQKMVLPE